MVFVLIFFISLVLFLGLLLWHRYRLEHPAHSQNEFIHHEYEPDVKEHAKVLYGKFSEKGHRYAKMSLHTAVYVYKNVRDNTTFFDQLKRKLRRYLYDHTPGHKKAHPAQFLDHVKQQQTLDENNSL